MTRLAALLAGALLSMHSAFAVAHTKSSSSSAASSSSSSNSAAPAPASPFVAPPSMDSFTHTVGYAGVPIRYKEVPTGPGTVCELTQGVKSYSGYAEVESGKFIFWWFFEARKGDPKKAKLATWNNGGPGSSSMIGLFQENGPCRISSSGDAVHNPFSWNEYANVLYIDQPVGTGFSYSDPHNGYISPSSSTVNLSPSSNTSITCPDYVTTAGLSCGTYSSSSVLSTVNSTAAGAPAFWRTLQAFMGTFPQYAQNGYALTTESFGGHYGPVYARYILEQNDAIAAAKSGNVKRGDGEAGGALANATHIDLQAIIIINGWYDPVIQFPAHFDEALHNYYDITPYSASIIAQIQNAIHGPGNCLDQLNACQQTGVNAVCEAAQTFCADEVEAPWDDVVKRDEYDMRELLPDPFPPKFYIDYLNQPSVRSALGAYVTFQQETFLPVYNAFLSTGDDVRIDGTTGDVQWLISKGIYFVQQTGDADYICVIHGALQVADKIGAPGYAQAGWVTLNTSVPGDTAPHGEVRQSGNYANVRFFQSGHEVPFYQPMASLQLFERTLQGFDMATGTVRVAGPGAQAGYKTTGPKDPIYHEGGATVQNTTLPITAEYDPLTGAPVPGTTGTGSSSGNGTGSASASASTGSNASTGANLAALVREHERRARSQKHLGKGRHLDARQVRRGLTRIGRRGGRQGRKPA